jgi:multiple sugar transport system ATP-binding protein
VAKVIIDKVYKSFPGGNKNMTTVNVLRQINLTIEDGEFMVLVGPSGCGKSTLLRIIAGLETLTGGDVFVGEKLVNNLPPKERDIAMVFQNYALYPHLNVYDNIAFGLRRMGNHQDQPWQKLLTFLTKKLPKSLRYLTASEQKINQQVIQVAQLLQIENLLARLPKQLSGGQRQRVALGRAIARQPQVFLMDEPLSNLDAKLRNETRSQIVKLQQQLGITTIYVTHDQTEAMTMGDRIAVMNQGQIQQIGKPLEIYNNPVNKFVAQFIGSPPINFLPMTVEKSQLVNPEFSLTIPKQWVNYLTKYQGKNILLGIRPENLTIAEPNPENIPVKINFIEALGNETYLSVQLIKQENITLQLRIPADIIVEIQGIIYLAINLNKIYLFDQDTEKNILDFLQN